MRYLRQNTATQVTVGPFFDKTDGVTPETALTVTNEKLTFVVDDAGVPTLVLDTAPTASGGSNDMVHITNDDAGYYALELTAANTNYLGRATLALTDAVNHCPVFHEFSILTQNAYDALFGTDLLQVDCTQQGGTTLTARDIGASVLLSSGTGTGQVSLNSGAVTAGTVSDKTGYALSSAGVQAIWDALTSALITVGSIGKKLADWVIGTAQTGDAFARLGAPAGASVSADIAAVKAQTGAIETDTQDLQTQVGTAGAGLTALGDTRLANLDATVSSRLAPAGTLATVTNLTNAPTSGDLTATMKTSVTTAATAATPTAAAVTGAVGSVTGNVGGNVTGSVGSVTAPVTAGTVSDKTGYALTADYDAAKVAAPASTALSSAVWTNTKAGYLDMAVGDVPTASENAAAVLAQTLGTEAYAADGAAPTLAQVLYMIYAGVAQFSITGTTLTVYKLDGTTAAMTFTLDSATAPTSRVRAS